MNSLVAILVILMVFTLSRADGKSEDKKTPIKIFKKYGCTECHSVIALEIGTSKSIENEEDEENDEEGEAIEPPDLSNVGSKYDAKWISGYLRKKNDIEGRKHKKRFKGSKEERRILSIWLESLKNVNEDSTRKNKSESPKAKN